MMNALPPDTLIVMSSTFVRGSVASASRIRPTKCFGSIAARPRPPSTLVDLPVQLPHDVIRDIDVERVRIDEQAQHAPRRAARAPQQIIPIEIVDADDAER